MLTSETAESHRGRLMQDDAEKNTNFVQIDRRVMAAHRELMSSSPGAAIVLSVLTEHMDKSNGIVISYSTLQELTGYSRAAVGRAIKKLKEDRWIQVVKVGTASVYVVNSRAFWTANAKGKFYSRFHATVVASAHEQSVGIEKLKALQLKEVPTIRNSERLLLNDDLLPPPDQADIELD